MFQIPDAVKVKKALTRNEVKAFYNHRFPPLQEKAKDFWFFSYACKGMNFKDIALLRSGDIRKDSFKYKRAKTAIKKRKRISLIEVELNYISRGVIKKYGNVSGSSGYVFPILKEGDPPEVIFKKVNNFVRATNQQLKHIAKTMEFPNEFSTYFARHSFASNMVEHGASIEFISEALNHSTTKVTQGYLSGFEQKTKSEYFKKLLDFQE